MWNGFYKLDNITDLKVLKQLFYDALELSTDSRVEILKHYSFVRERFDRVSPKDYIDCYLTLEDHNVFIDRLQYSQGTRQEGEIGSSTQTDDVLFLFIIVSLDNLNKLAEKYQLHKYKF